MFKPQHREEEERPIGFISKAIHLEHVSWDVPMKEGFAIYYALGKWEYLLRDRRFTILTDHENLTRLRSERLDTNQMVKRWFTAFQNYDIINWKWKKGVENMVPDEFSRLCQNEIAEDKDLKRTSMVASLVSLSVNEKAASLAVELNSLSGGEVPKNRWFHMDEAHRDISEIENHYTSCTTASCEHKATILHQLTGYEVPTDKWDIIKQHHNAYVGHGGVERTLARLDEAELVWPDRTKHVTFFKKMCPCCQKMDRVKRVVHSIPYTLSTYGLWETVSVDLIEGLQPDEEGNTCIVVIVDNFSRFTDLHAVKGTDAESLAGALTQFCGRYATPARFTTDNGKNFKSELVESLFQLVGAEHHTTHAYSKQENAIVERDNKEIMRHLENIVFEKRVNNKWSKYLPIIMRIINSSIHSSTGLKPAEIVFPNGIQLDRNLFPNNPSIMLSSYMQDLEVSQAHIIAIAQHHLKERDEKHKARKRAKKDKITPTTYTVGSYVLAEHRNNSLRRGPKCKVLPFLKGPLKVVHKKENDHYALLNLVTQSVTDYHSSRLRPFLYDERTLTPLQVACTDSFQEFIVGSVVSFKGKASGSIKNLQFKVRWAGYDDPREDTWEPYSFLRDTDALQDFLWSHPSKAIKKKARMGYIPTHLRVPVESDEENQIE